MKLHVLIKISRKSGVIGWDGERLTVAVDAPPVEGAANARLVEIMSDWLDVSKSRIQITRGLTSRFKTLEADVQPMQLAKLIDAAPQLPHQEKLF